MFLKRKINYIDLLKLITQIGYERFNTLNQDLKQHFKYEETYFYLVWQIINCFIFQRMLKYQKIIKDDVDIFKDISPFILDAIKSDYIDDISLGYIQIKDEILKIWKNDNDTNSNSEINRTANYLVNEILMCDDNDFLDLKAYLSNIIINCHFENKNIMKNYKIT